MDSNQKPLPSLLPPPLPPPPPPPKNGSTKGHPPLLSVNLHDEGDGGAVGAGDMEVAALRCRSPRATHHELSESGRGLEVRASSHGETKMPLGSLVGCPGRDEATAKQRGLPRRHSRVLARLGSAGVGTFAVEDDQAYTCAVCSMTFGRETALYGHMRSHKRGQLSSEFEENVPIPKRRKKRESTMKPLEAIWGNTERRNGWPKDAPSEIQCDLEVNNHNDNDNFVIVIDDDDDYANPVITVEGSHGSPDPAPDTGAALAMVPAPAVAVGTPMPTPHGTTTSVNIEGAPATASTTVETIPQAPAPAPAAATTITRAPLTTAVSVATQIAFDLVTGSNSSGQVGACHRYGGNGKAIAGNNNDCGKSFACYGNVDYGKGVAGYSDPGYGGKGLAGCSSGNPVHQPPHGTMAMAGNLVTGRFSAANTSTGWSLPVTTSTILPVTPLHNLEQNPPERIVALALGNHGHRSINPALFSFSRRQDIAVVPRNAIASSSSTPRPGIVADTEPSQAIGINNYFAAIDAPANTVGRRLPFFLDGRSNTQALPISWPVHHRMAMDGNPLTGCFPAGISAIGWSFPASTNNVVPSIPLHNQEDGCCRFNPALFSKRQEKNPLEAAVGPSNAITCSTSTPHTSVAAATEPPQVAEVNNNVAAIDALCNTMCHSFFLTDRSAIHAPPVSMPVHQSAQGMSAIVGNAVTGHFPTTMAGNGCSFPVTTSSVLPTIPLQTQEENPSQGRVVPTNGEHPSTRLFGSGSFPTFPSQNQAENPPEDIVAGNNGGRIILRLFGFDIAEGPKEVDEPKK